MTFFERRTWPRRIAFVCANLAIAALTWVCLLAPALDVLDLQASRIQTESLRLQRLQSVIERANENVANKGATGAAGDRYLLQGSSEGSRNANLQEILRSDAQAAGLQIQSIETLTTPTDMGFPSAGARIEVTGSLRAIQAFAYTIETSTPILFITANSIRAANVPPTPGGSDEPQYDCQIETAAPKRQSKA